MLPNVPTGHTPHESAPESAFARPAGQSTQLLLPPPCWPGGHAVHAVAATPLKVAAGHGVHAVEEALAA